jgi:hypothetical protein
LGYETFSLDCDFFFLGWETFFEVESVYSPVCGIALEKVAVEDSFYHVIYCVNACILFVICSVTGSGVIQYDVLVKQTFALGFEIVGCLIVCGH